MIFYFLLMSFSQIISKTYYEYVYYLNIGKSLEYDASFTTISVLDVSKVKGDTIYVEYKVDLRTFPTNNISYNFTDENVTSNYFTCEKVMKVSQSKHSNIKKNKRIVGYITYYYFYFPKGNETFLVLENPVRYRSKITITFLTHNVMKTDLILGIILSVAIIVVSILIAVFIIWKLRKEKASRNEYPKQEGTDLGPIYS